MLNLKLVKELFPFTSGIIDDNIDFRFCFTNYFEKAPKGLYVPFQFDHYDSHIFLKDAINQGAIAALWQNGIQLPSYTPSMFPIFYVDNPLIALSELIEFYRCFLHDHQDVNDKTIFQLSSPLKKNKESSKLGGIHMFYKDIDGLNGGI